MPFYSQIQFPIFSRNIGVMEYGSTEKAIDILTITPLLRFNNANLGIQLVISKRPKKAGFREF